jgi:hypothetical protein
MDKTLQMSFRPSATLSSDMGLPVFFLYPGSLGFHIGGSLLRCSIGVSPSRLHYDRTANYGSIIVPSCNHRQYKQHA